jgi:excisionase family DNA binding protein
MNNELTIREFAEAVGVSHDTVTRWVKAKKVEGKKSGVFPGKTNAILIPRSELTRVEKLLKARAGSAATER